MKKRLLATSLAVLLSCFMGTTAFAATNTLDYSKLAFQDGDINRDEQINADDLTLTIQILLGIKSGNPQADANDDGLFNIIDLVCIKKVITDS